MLESETYTTDRDEDIPRYPMLGRGYRYSAVRTIATVLTGLLLSFASSAFAVLPSTDLSQYGHTSWKVRENGLMHTPISIAQTQDGYIYVGTASGLLTFDGVRFKNNFLSDSNGLGFSTVRFLATASNGDLYIGSWPGRLGLLRNGHLRVVQAPWSTPGPFAELPGGHMWSGTGRDGPQLSACDVTSLVCHGEQPLTACSRSFSIAADHDGGLWIGGNGRICHWGRDGSSQEFELPQSGPGPKPVTAVAVDSKGVVWAGVAEAGTGAGLLRFSDDKWQAFSAPSLHGQKLKVQSLLSDSQGALWIGTIDSGLYRLTSAGVDHFDRAAGLTGNAISQIFEDSEGSVWVVTPLGIDQFRDLAVLTYTSEQGLSDAFIPALATDRKSSVWIGSHDGLRILRSGDPAPARRVPVPIASILYLFHDREDRMWVSGDHKLGFFKGGQFHMLSRDPEDASGVTVGMFDDGQGGIWDLENRLGSPERGGIYHINGIGRIEKAPLAAGYENAPIDGGMIDPSTGEILIESRDGILGVRRGVVEELKLPKGFRPSYTFQSDGEGDGVWNLGENGIAWIKNDQVRVLSQADGLPCPLAYGLVSDATGNLWLYMQCGLVSVRADDLEKWKRGTLTGLRFSTLNAIDGVDGSSAKTQPASTSDGRLWFTAFHNVQSFAPNSVRRNVHIPPVHIESVLAGHRPTELDGTIDLPPSTAEIEIHYTALSFVVPERVQFRYRLSGSSDVNWVDAGSRRVAFFDNLKPGKYVFQVLGSNNDGLWNERPAEFHFIIEREWYQTIWFRVLVLAIACATGLLLYSVERMRYAALLRARFNDRLDERTRLARDLHDTLLQTIQASKLVAENVQDSLGDPGRAKKYLDKLSYWLDQAMNEGRLALESLRSSSGTTSSFPKSLQEIVDQYAEPAVEIILTVSGRLRSIHQVAQDEFCLIAAEAIRNAILHSKGSMVLVSVRYGRNFLMTISDNGAGFSSILVSESKPGHFGMAGMLERASSIGARVLFENGPTGGAVVAVKAPGRVVFRSQTLRQKFTAVGEYFGRWFRTSRT